MLKRFRHWRDAFYAGPRFLGVQPIRRNGYQSPTLTAAQWAYGLVMRHFTLPGRILFVCSGLFMLYGMSTLDMPIHLLAFTILVLFALDVGVGFLLRPRLAVTRRMPVRVSAGSEVRLDYTVQNRSRLVAWDVCVDTLPFPADLGLSRGRAYLATLAPGESVRATAFARATRRGRFTLPSVRADSAFPFNLWRWGSTGATTEPVIVYPEFTPLRQLELETGRRYQPGGIALSSDIGDSMEFLGCREFRDGDDPRHLHWRSWARTSYPVVKEFREEYFCRTALIIDTRRTVRRFMTMSWRPPPDRTFEAALSLGAAVADFLAAQDYVVDLFAAGPDVYRFRGGRGLAYLENILDILACLQPSGGEPFAEFSAELIREIARISSAMFILLTWNETRQRLIEEMAAAGVTVKALLVTSDGTAPPDLPPTIRVLSAADIRAGRCTEL